MEPSEGPPGTPGKPRRCQSRTPPARRPATPLTPASRAAAGTPLRVEEFDGSTVMPAPPAWRPPHLLRLHPEGPSLPPDFGLPDRGAGLPLGPDLALRPPQGYAEAAARRLSALRCSALPSPTKLGHGLRAACTPPETRCAQLGLSPLRSRSRLFAEGSPALLEKTGPQCWRGAPLDLESPGPQLTPPQESPSTSVQTQISRFLSDPAWGDLEFVDGGPSRWQAFGFGICPCFMVGCGGRWRCCASNQTLISSLSARRAWCRFLLCFSTLVSLLQAATFAGTVLHAGGFEPVSMNALWGPHPYFLDLWGAKNAARIRFLGEWWRLITPNLLHSGLGHLLANLVVQVRLGVSLELRWGHWRWLQVYVLSGIYSEVASCIFLPGNLSVGSSGAICGLLGAEIVFMVLTWRQTEPRDVADRNIQICAFVFTVLVTGGLSFLPMVDFAAHAGGFVMGVLLATVLFADRADGERKAAAYRLRAVAGLLLVCLSVVSVASMILWVQPDKKLLHICRPREC